MPKKTTKKKAKQASKPAGKSAARKASAAPKEEVNKSQAIRELMASNPRLKPAAIAAKLKEQGIHVTAQYVSTIKSNTKKSKRRRRPADGATVLPRRAGDISVTQLLEVRDLVEQLGGIGKVQQALDVLKKLQ